MTKEEFFSLNLDYNNYSWKELDEIAGVGESTTKYWLKKAGIKKGSRGNGSEKRKLVGDGSIERLVKEGYSTSQIAEKVGLTARQVTSYRNKQSIGVDSNPEMNRFDKISISSIQEQVIIGSLLGDGWIDVADRDRNYCRLCFQHSIKQSEYCIYKYNLMKEIGNYPTITSRPDQFWKYCEDNYKQITFKSDQNPIFEEYRQNWYIPKKRIYRPDFEKLDVLGLAIWYMDDGSNSKKGGCIIHCQGFPLEDVEYMKDFLTKKFNLELFITKRNQLYITKESKKILFKLIESFVPNTMKYKVIASK